MDNRDLEKLAQLARLKIADGERDALVHSLNEILIFVERLNIADLEQVEPLSHPLDMQQRLRADKASESDQSAQLQAIAPAARDGFYTVPKVIDESQ